MDRNEAYINLTDLISKGFLTAEMEFSDKSFVFKTITEKEFDLAKILSGSPDRADHTVRFNTYFLSLSLFSLDGHNVLIRRNEELPELFEFFQSFPDKFFGSMVESTSQLRDDSYEVIKYLEGFSYTNRSRRLWNILGGKFPNCEEFTGIPGSSCMGLNVHQESWISINKMLDDEEEYNRSFSLALLISSASNPKGSRRIRSQHDSSVKSSEDRRMKLAEIGYIDETKWSPDGWAAPVDTVDGLVSELERQMKGIKDKHDIFIEGYLRKLKENAENRVKEAKERIRQARIDSEEAFIEGSQRALTPEETRDMMKKRSKRIVSVRPEEQASQEDKDKFLSKIGNKVLTSRS